MGVSIPDWMANSHYFWLFLMLLPIGLGFFLSWWAIKAIRTGEIKPRKRLFLRSETPVRFWAYWLVLVCLAVFAFQVGFDSMNSFRTSNLENATSGPFSGEKKM